MSDLICNCGEYKVRTCRKCEGVEALKLQLEEERKVVQELASQILQYSFLFKTEKEIIDATRIKVINAAKGKG